MSNDNVQRTVDAAGEILGFYEAQIQDFLAGGAKRQITVLTKQAAEDFGVPVPVAYNLLALHLQYHPEVMAKQGRDGGIVLRTAEEQRRAESEQKKAERAGKSLDRILKNASALTPEQRAAVLATLQAGK